jgi:hypothetical protein
MTRITLLLVALSSLALGSGPAEERLDGPDSIYTRWLADVLIRWPASRPDADGRTGLQITCAATAADAGYVGMIQQMTIAAPLTAVEQVLDDVPRYKDLFPGVVDVQVLPGSRIGRRYVTVWEQRVPVFFLPNVTYELANIVDKSSPGLRVYRYKLLRTGSMLASDGMVVLESLGPESTRFTEYDFFNAQWGALPASAVWRESLRGAFASDMAIKLRAENPRWSLARVAAEAAQRLESEAEQVEQCYRQRLPAPRALRAASDVLSRREARTADLTAP